MYSNVTDAYTLVSPPTINIIENLVANVTIKIAYQVSTDDSVANFEDLIVKLNNVENCLFLRSHNFWLLTYLCNFRHFLEKVHNKIGNTGWMLKSRKKCLGKIEKFPK